MVVSLQTHNVSSLVTKLFTLAVRSQLTLQQYADSQTDAHTWIHTHTLQWAHNAFRMLHNLHMRCSASFMFANALVDSCSTCIRKCIFSLMSRLNTSTNVIVQSTLNSDVYTTSESYQRCVKALYT